MNNNVTPGSSDKATSNKRPMPDDNDSKRRKVETSNNEESTNVDPAPSTASSLSVPTTSAVVPVNILQNPTTSFLSLPVTSSLAPVEGSSVRYTFPRIIQSTPFLRQSPLMGTSSSGHPVHRSLFARQQWEMERRRRSMTADPQFTGVLYTARGVSIDYILRRIFHNPDFRPNEELILDVEEFKRLVTKYTRTYSTDTITNLEEVCVICYMKLKNEDSLVRELRCSHRFHKSCIDEWLIKQMTCPICRLPLHDSNENVNAIQLEEIFFRNRDHQLSESDSDDQNDSQGSDSFEFDTPDSFPEARREEVEEPASNNPPENQPESLENQQETVLENQVENTAENPEEDKNVSESENQVENTMENPEEDKNVSESENQVENPEEGKNVSEDECVGF